MAKISIFPTDAIKIKIGNTYEYFKDVMDADGSYDIGDQKNISLKASLSDYCPTVGATSCSYDIFNDQMSASQYDVLYRKYTVTYIDDNDCSSSNTFRMTDKIFTRPIDDVTSAEPKRIREMWDLTYHQWWLNGSPTATTKYWDSDSAFATVQGETCQGICNGFELSTDVFTEFWSGTTDVTDAGYGGRDIPWDDITWTKVDNVADWWCHPIELGSNTQSLLEDGTPVDDYNHKFDITGGTYNPTTRVNTANGCFGLWYKNREPDEHFVLSGRRSYVTYGTNAYSGSAPYRLGKFVIKLRNSVDAFSSLGGINTDNSTASISACSYNITNYNHSTFTATTEDSRFTRTITGNTVHFMSPVEVYVFQKSETPPVATYTYTVRSNVNGANVTWGHGASGSATISGGKAVTSNTTGDYVTATLSYGSTIFQNNGAAITKNGSVTINSAATPTYTYTVYSDVEGASVSWSNGTTGAISGGFHQISTTTTSTLTVTLSKAGVTFVNGGTGYCAPGGSVTINRYNPPVACTVTLALNSNLDGHGAGSTSETLGSYSVTSSCAGLPTLELVSGNDVLKNISFVGTTIKGSWDYTKTNKTGTYRLSYGSSTSNNVSVTVLGACNNTSSSVSPTAISHIYANGRAQHFILVRPADCWSVTSVSTDAPFMTAQASSTPATSENAWVVTVDCLAGSLGIYGNVYINTRSADGTTAQHKVRVTWV